jgi:uncharacterized protein (TIGR02118 family)
LTKVIFILQRRAGQTREQCYEQWSGQQHTSIVKSVPGLRRWVQNRVSSAPDEAVCDGIGELWFDSPVALEQALGSPEMAAASEDSKRFLDMERTAMLIVAADTIIGEQEERP